MFIKEGSIFYKMKNKYLAKCLSLTLVSAMLISASGPVYSAEPDIYDLEIQDGELQDDSDIFVDQEIPSEEFVTPGITPAPEITETPGDDEVPEITGTPEDDEVPEITGTPESDEIPEITVIPTPTEPLFPDVTIVVTPTPDSDLFDEELVIPEVTITPQITVTPTEEPELTITPTPQITPTVTPEEIQKIIDRIKKFLEDKPKDLTKISPEYQQEMLEIRRAYDSLSEEAKLLVLNYEDFKKLEKAIQEKNDMFSDEENTLGDGSNDLTAGIDVITGAPVYYNNMVSNIHAGNEFYLNSLSSNYQLSFSEDFAEIMEEIETEYKTMNKLVDISQQKGYKTTTSADELLVRNWQDILAVYVYEQSKEGVKEFKLGRSSKERLSEIFKEMNPVIRNKQDITQVEFGNLHINSYIKKNNIPKKDREILKKYVETDCKLLCAVVTAAKGFVRESVGDNVSEERVNVITAAYSLVGKVGYFWGGKSTVLGMDSRWGTAARVVADGSPSTGTVRAYGLDCSGFVTWAVVNGYQNAMIQGRVGEGTTAQWFNAGVVSEANAQPGDLVFEKGPESGSDNHVGILCGRTDAGDWIAVHCSSGRNGVTVGEAYGASFRYIRKPTFYPTEAEIGKMKANGIVSGVIREGQQKLEDSIKIDDGAVYLTDVTATLDSILTAPDSLFENVVEIPEPEILTEPEVLVDNSQIMPF